MARPMEKHPDRVPVPAHFLLHPRAPFSKIAALEHRSGRVGEETKIAGLQNQAGYSMAICVSVLSTPSSD